MSFNNLPLIEPIRAALSKQGYTTPTSIQQQAIPHILDGKDLLGCAQTGTGKTGAFTLPLLQLMFQRFDRRIVEQAGHFKALILLTPTRELAHPRSVKVLRRGRLMDVIFRLNHEVIFRGRPTVGSGKDPFVKVLRYWLLLQDDCWI